MAESGRQHTGGSAGRGPKPSGNQRGTKRGGASKPGGSRGSSRSGKRPGASASKAPGARSTRTAKPDADRLDEELISAAAAEGVLPAEVVGELDAFPPRVAQLLSAAYVVLPDDPAEAVKYAQAARRIAPRSAIVREALGMCAYHAGDYASAHAELRAAGRISGSQELLPLIADCERALGRPERALELAAGNPDLNRAGRIEMRIVAAGARLDLGQPEEAMVLLRGPMLDTDEAGEESARVKYAYAQAVLAAGDVQQAAEWFRRAAMADVDAVTDAADRAVELSAQGEGES